MPAQIIIDTSPLVACFNPDDAHHASCLEKLRLLKGRRLATSLAVMTEVTYLLDFSAKNQQKFLHFMASGVIELRELAPADLKAAAILMEKYASCPMDFTDATLVLLAERLKTRQIFTLDLHDFNTYRLKNNDAFDIL